LQKKANKYCNYFLLAYTAGVGGVLRRRSPAGLAMEMMMATVFAVFWVSERGFANEGSYVYGDIAKIRASVNQLDASNARWSKESQHKTLAAARRAAILLTRRGRREYRDQQMISSLSAVQVDGGEHQAKIDDEVVAYGWQADR
jgi:hypothetical protein